MSKKAATILGVMGLLAIIVPLVVGIGCSRQDQPAAPQQQAPMQQTMPMQQTPSPAPAPPAPMPQSGAPMTQQAPMVPAPMVSAQNVSSIQLGMTSEQVRQLMGNPSMTKPEGQFVEWEYYTPQGKCEVKFQNDRVVSVGSH